MSVTSKCTDSDHRDGSKLSAQIKHRVELAQEIVGAAAAGWNWFVCQQTAGGRLDPRLGLDYGTLAVSLRFISQDMVRTFQPDTVSRHAITPTRILRDPSRRRSKMMTAIG